MTGIPDYEAEQIIERAPNGIYLFDDGLHDWGFRRDVLYVGFRDEVFNRELTILSGKQEAVCFGPKPSIRWETKMYFSVERTKAFVPLRNFLTSIIDGVPAPSGADAEGARE